MSKTLPTESLSMLCKTLIEPQIRYCSIIWGNCGEVLKEKLQILQNRAARIITRTTYDTVNHFALLRQLKWLDVRSIIKLEMGLFMYKAIGNFFQGLLMQQFPAYATFFNFHIGNFLQGLLMQQFTGYARI